MLKRKLPPLVWQTPDPPALASVQPLGEGDFCRCYLINQTHVLRIAKHAAASAALGRERLLLPKLAGWLDTPIPQIQHAGIRADSGAQFVCYPLVPGTVLEAATLAGLDPACRARVVGQMAAWVGQLHSFPVEIARPCGLAERDPRRFLPELMDQARVKLASYLEAAVWRYYHQLLDRYLATPALHAYAPTLLHGDLSPEHVLADPTGCRLTGVIDFGDSCIGDPDWDLIYLLEDYGPEILDLFLTHYAPARPQARQRVRLFQQFNNLAYCLASQREANAAEFAAALAILASQATTQAIV